MSNSQGQIVGVTIMINKLCKVHCCVCKQEITYELCGMCTVCVCDMSDVHVQCVCIDPQMRRHRNVT